MAGRDKELLDYIEQLKKFSDNPVDEEDLYAAGFDEDDLEAAGWFDKQEPLKADIPREGPSISAREPSLRENLHERTRSGLESLGLSENLSEDLATSVAGSPSSPMGMGLADFTPLGIPTGVEEGAEQFEKGWNEGSPVDIASGALGAGTSLMGGKVAVDGIKAFAGKLADGYDPTVMRTFFGPSSERADLAELKAAKDFTKKGYSPEEVWKNTGWWNTPNGWRFEVSDHNLELNPEALKFYEAGGTTVPLTKGMDHQDFWDGISGSGKLGERQEHSLEMLPTKMHTSGYYDSQKKKINVTAKNEEELKNVLVHELQHYEQKAFDQPSKGANFNYVRDQIASTVDNLPREALEYLATSSYYIKKMRDSEKAIAKAETYNKDFSQGDDLIDLDILYNEQSDILRDAQKAHDELVKDIGPEFAEKLDDLWLLSGGYSGAVKKVDDYNFEVSPQQAAREWSTGGHKAYERNWGETEARTSAYRRDMSPEERRMWFPGNSPDVEEYKDEGFWGSHEEFVDTLRLVNIYADDFRNSVKKRGYAKGGVVEVDPISGNEVPPGSEPVEVRDDIDAKLSEGEYVIPADVVRYLGLDKIEKLVEQAKQGLAEMDANGRIGGEEVVEEDDLPFTDEELFSEEAPVAMAVGGLVQPAGDRILGGIGANSPVPLWMQDNSLQENALRPNKDRPGETQATSKWDKDVSQWSPEQFSEAVAQRNDPGAAVVGKIVSKVPFGGLMMRAKQNYVNKKAPGVIDGMLKTGLDVQGNPLTDQQKVDLVKAKEGLVATKNQQSNLMGLAFREAKSLISPKQTPEQKAKKDAEKAAKEKSEKDRSEKSKSEKDKDKNEKQNRK